jgi:hypothetical protein
MLDFECEFKSPTDPALLPLIGLPLRIAPEIRQRRSSLDEKLSMTDYVTNLGEPYVPASRSEERDEGKDFSRRPAMRLPPRKVFVKR